MADKSVFSMSGPASEKLAALQTLSYTERPSTYDQELSKLVCSFMRPISEVNSLSSSPPQPPQLRREPTANQEGPSESVGKALPFSIFKPAESWSEVGVRTVADLKTAMSSKKVPAAKKSPLCDRGVDWRLRSSLYFDFHNERTVRLPYEIPNLPQRSESPSPKMEGCTNLTSGQVLDAMKVLEPPKRPTPCKPYSPPKSNTPPRPQGKLPLNNLPVSVPPRRKSQNRPPPGQNNATPVVKQGVTPTPLGKARMKFTKRRSDLEKNPLTGLLEPKITVPLIRSFGGAPDMLQSEISKSKDAFYENNNKSKVALCESNNNYLIDKYTEVGGALVQDSRSEHASTKSSSCSSPLSVDRRDSCEGSTITLYSQRSVEESCDRSTIPSTKRKITALDSSCQDSVISSSEQPPPTKLKRRPSAANADDSQDVEFFDLTIVDESEASRDDTHTCRENMLSPPAVCDAIKLKFQGEKETASSMSTSVSRAAKSSPVKVAVAPVPSRPRPPVVTVAKQNAATQTQQSMSQQAPPHSPAAVKATTTPKMINLFDLYRAVTKMKSSQAQSGSCLDLDLYTTRGQLALRMPESTPS